MTIETIFTIAAAWLGLLLLACAIRAAWAPDPASRILALDTLGLLLVGLLASYSTSEGVPYYFDAALVLALLGFVATIAAARYHGEDGPFG